MTPGTSSRTRARAQGPGHERKDTGHERKDPGTSARTQARAQGHQAHCSKQSSQGRQSPCSSESQAERETVAGVCPALSDTRKAVGLLPTVAPSSRAAPGLALRPWWEAPRLQVAQGQEAFKHGVNDVFWDNPSQGNTARKLEPRLSTCSAVFVIGREVTLVKPSF
uniref:Uncharacterized protein n=1 Tax=Molossus molossus TaxID=27622 RepID=A0A7J8ERB1_MOLMO|nr:hypothetical protein HJG59_008633 [Molossus molossus]